MNNPVTTGHSAEIAEIMLELSDHIVNAKPQDLLAKLGEALCVIGSKFAVDRAYIASYNQDINQEKKIVSWSATQGILSSDQSEILNLEEFPWWQELALHNAELNLSCIDMLPEQATNEKKYYLRHGIQANLELNLFINNNLMGFIGFEMLSCKRTWSAAEMRTLRFMGNICIGAIQQCNTLEKLNNLIGQQEFLVNISNKFIHIATDQIDNAIAETLESVGIQTDADRIYIDLFNTTDSIEKLEFEYIRPSLQGKFDSLHEINLTLFPWWQKQINKDNIIAISSPLDFPPEATVERDFFLSLGIISNLEVNLYDGDNLIGFLGTEFMLKQQYWGENEISFLKLLAEIISSALARKNIQKKLGVKLNFEAMLFNASNILLRATMDNYIPQMEQALSIIATNIMAERAYLLTGNDSTESPCRLLCAWTSDNFIAKKEILPSTPFRNYDWWSELNNQKQSILVSDINNLPPEAIAEKSFYRTNGILSHIAIPLAQNGQTIGHLGFEAFSKPQPWNEEILKQMRLTGDVFSGVIARIIAETKLYTNNKLLLEAQEIGHIGSWEWDTQRNKWTWSNEIYRILDYKHGEINPNTNAIIERLHPEDRQRIFAVMNNDSLIAVQSIETSFRILLNDGKEKHIYLRARRTLGENHTLRICGTIQDITIQKLHENELRYISLHDRLTGLENRTAYEDYLKENLSEKNLPLGVISGDVNGLKLINDSFGHSEGDKLLKRMASIMRSCLRTGDRIFRIGGDEFMIFLPDTDIRAAESIADQMKEYCKKAKTSYRLPLSISFGIDSVTNRSTDIASILKEAEDRMYQNKLLESKSARNSVIASLQETLAEKTSETEAHSKRLQTYSALIGNSLGLSAAEKDQLMLLSALHDIGKIAVAESILHKNGALDSAEWIEIKKHPETGYRIAQATPELAPVASSILAHHERWDGKGYPQGLSEEGIPLLARIINIVDSFDVMINGRPYKNPMRFEDALKEIADCAGSQFDPTIAKIFIREMPITESIPCI